jgi:hypothetical protein
MSWTITPQTQVPVDPFRSQVSLLLHGDGTNGSTTITDSSPSPKTVTAAGNAQISTAQSKFGGASLNAGTTPNFAWGSNRLQVPAGADFAYGTGNFTAEAWLYITSFTGGVSWWTQTVGGTNYFLNFVSSTGIPTFIFATSGGGTSVFGPAITANTWNHVAVVRNSNVVTIYSNGTGGTSVNCAQNFDNTTYIPTIGSYTHDAATLVFNGYIDDLRITKGVARYTANFTPPGAPFPDI